MFDAAEKAPPLLSAVCSPALRELLRMRLEEKVDKAAHVPSHSSVHKCLPAVSGKLPLHTAKVRLASHPERGGNTGVCERLKRNPAVHPCPSRAPLRPEQ